MHVNPKDAIFVNITEPRGRVRAALTPEDFNKPNGTAIDGPELPIKILIDDIEQVVIEAEQTSLVSPQYYSYLLSPYPPSHYVS